MFRISGGIARCGCACVLAENCDHVRHATSPTKAGGSDARAFLQCHKKCTRCTDSDGAVQFRLLRPCLCTKKSGQNNYTFSRFRPTLSAVRPLATPVSLRSLPNGHFWCRLVGTWHGCPCLCGTPSGRGHTHVLVLFGPRQIQIDLLYHGVAAGVHCTQHLLDFDNCVHMSGTASDQLFLLSAHLGGRTPIRVMYFLPRYLKIFLSLWSTKCLSFTPIDAVERVDIPIFCPIFFLPSW